MLELLAFPVQGTGGRFYVGAEEALGLLRNMGAVMHVHHVDISDVSVSQAWISYSEWKCSGPDGPIFFLSDPNGFEVAPLIATIILAKDQNMPFREAERIVRLSGKSRVRFVDGIRTTVPMMLLVDSVNVSIRDVPCGVHTIYPKWSEVYEVRSVPDRSMDKMLPIADERVQIELHVMKVKHPLSAVKYAAMVQTHYTNIIEWGREDYCEIAAASHEPPVACQSIVAIESADESNFPAFVQSMQRTDSAVMSFEYEDGSASLLIYFAERWFLMEFVSHDGPVPCIVYMCDNYASLLGVMEYEGGRVHVLNPQKLDRLYIPRSRMDELPEFKDGLVVRYDTNHGWIAHCTSGKGDEETVKEPLAVFSGKLVARLALPEGTLIELHGKPSKTKSQTGGIPVGSKWLTNDDVRKPCRWVNEDGQLSYVGEAGRHLACLSTVVKSGGNCKVVQSPDGYYLQVTKEIRPGHRVRVQVKSKKRKLEEM